MRSASIMVCALASLLVARSVHAQSLFPPPVLDAPPLDVDFQFHDDLRVAAQTQEGASKTTAEGGAQAATSGTTTSGAESTGSQCQCPDCQTAETAHACDKCPRVNNVNPAWGLTIGGNITLDALFNSSRPVAPGTPFFLA